MYKNKPPYTRLFKMDRDVSVHAIGEKLKPGKVGKYLTVDQVAVLFERMVENTVTWMGEKYTLYPIRLNNVHVHYPSGLRRHLEFQIRHGVLSSARPARGFTDDLLSVIGGRSYLKKDLIHELPTEDTRVTIVCNNHTLELTARNDKDRQLWEVIKYEHR